MRYQGFSWQGKPGSCPEGVASIDKLGGFCIEKYEAVAWNVTWWISKSNQNALSSTDTTNVLTTGAYANSMSATPMGVCIADASEN
ncbi:MAG: hypothetical protein V1875_06960 [Candidatus Altiarchaeota archaeon]